MASPFPGMNPYLEHPQLWPEVHNRLIIAIANAIESNLSRKYRVAIEKRTYTSLPFDSILVGIPDISVISKKSSSSQTSSTITKRRVANKLSEGLKVALADKVQPESFKDFQALHNWVQSIVRRVRGLGATTAYDVARRLGAWLGIKPVVVYLHAGTAIGGYYKECLMSTHNPKFHTLKDGIIILHSKHLGDIVEVHIDKEKRCFYGIREDSTVIEDNKECENDFAQPAMLYKIHYQYGSVKSYW